MDGFRCDVASLVPVDFWIEARKACEAIKPNLIWLGETVHKSFQCEARRQGMEAIYSDAEGYAAFDIEYGYEIRELLDDYWAGERPLHEWVEALNLQECMYPANYIKLRCLENHDQPRIAGRISDPAALSNWHALMFMLKGTPMIYSGEEYCDANQPSLFDVDPVNWSGRDISAEIQKLAALKKRMPEKGWFMAQADDGQHAVHASAGDGKMSFSGLFSLKAKPAKMKTDAPDGSYANLLDGTKVTVSDDMIETDGRPVIIEW